MRSPNPARRSPAWDSPLARLVAVISLAIGAVRELALGPSRGKETGETGLFGTLWDRCVTGDIVLGDRNVASFFGIAPLRQRGVDGLFRMHQRRTYDLRRGRRLGVEDHEVRWTKPKRPEWMNEALYAQLPEELLIRELRVRVERDGFRVDQLLLVKTLLDPQESTKTKSRRVRQAPRRSTHRGRCFGAEPDAPYVT